MLYKNAIQLNRETSGKIVSVRVGIEEKSECRLRFRSHAHSDFMWAQQGSNLRPKDYESPTLTN